MLRYLLVKTVALSSETIVRKGNSLLCWYMTLKVEIIINLRIVKAHQTNFHSKTYQMVFHMNPKPNENFTEPGINHDLSVIDF